MTREDLLGVLLAGGRSSRFGRPKWWAELDGTPMIERAARALAPHVAETIAISHDASLESVVDAVVPDRRPDLGPVEGVRTGLLEARARGHTSAFVLACDMPLVTADVVGRIVGSAREGAAAVPLSETGREPLCALYPAGLADALETLLDRGVRSARAMLEEIPLVEVELPAELRAADPFRSVNRGADLRRLERRSRGEA